MNKQDKNALYTNRNWLWQRYIMNKKSMADMAKEAGCSVMTIQRALEKHGLIRKS